MKQITEIKEDNLTLTPESGAANLVKDCSQPLIHRMARAMWACKMAFESDLNEGEFKLNGPVTYILLNLLEQNDGLSQNDLTNSTRVDASIITRAVKHLEHELGWIRRERDVNDNRLMRVYLTEEGRAQSRALSSRVEELEKRLTRNLSKEQLDEFIRTLQILEETARGDYGEQRKAV